MASCGSMLDALELVLNFLSFKWAHAQYTGRHFYIEGQSIKDSMLIGDTIPLSCKRGQAHLL